METTEITQTLEQSIDILADKLGAPAEQLMDIAVTGVMVEGIAVLILSLMGSAAALLLTKWLFENWKGWGDVYDPRSILAPIGIISIIFFSLIGIYEGAIKAFAPAYWIIKQIIL